MTTWINTRHGPVKAVLIKKTQEYQLRYGDCSLGKLTLEELHANELSLKDAVIEKLEGYMARERDRLHGEFLRAMKGSDRSGG